MIITLFDANRRGRDAGASESSSTVSSVPDEKVVALADEWRLVITTSGMRPEGFAMARRGTEIVSISSTVAFSAASRYVLPFKRFVGAKVFAMTSSSTKTLVSGRALDSDITDPSVYPPVSLS
jgi:hypothetical protein